MSRPGKSESGGTVLWWATEDVAGRDFACPCGSIHRAPLNLIEMRFWCDCRRLIEVSPEAEHDDQPFFRRMAELEAEHDTTIGMPPGAELARWYCIECEQADDSADRMTMHGANTGHQPFYGTKSDRDHHRGVLLGGK